jgi:hypothetical protein
MKMNDHQKLIWQNMVDFIQKYLDGETKDFYSLVGKLEGELDASEIKDDLLINQWYIFWTPLETRRAIQGNNVDKEKAIYELTQMKDFLIKTKNEF